MNPPRALLSLLAAAALWAASACPALAQSECVTLRNGDTACPAPDSRCVKDRYGDWLCSQPGGDAKLDFHGDPVCGAGACVKDIQNQIMCSTQPRGSAALDRYNMAVCTGSCAVATRSCKTLTR